MTEGRLTATKAREVVTAAKTTIDAESLAVWLPGALRAIEKEAKKGNFRCELWVGECRANVAKRALRSLGYSAKKARNYDRGYIVAAWKE